MANRFFEYSVAALPADLNDPTQAPDPDNPISTPASRLAHALNAANKANPDFKLILITSMPVGSGSGSFAIYRRLNHVIAT